MRFEAAYYDSRVYSQFGEDGITLELVRRLDPSKRFLEIGAGTGEENCTRILSTLTGWYGVWCDPLLQTWPPNVEAVISKVTLDNIDALKDDDVGVLSIDVDGNDYHLWKAYGHGPAIVIIEAQVQRPLHLPYVMPYDPEYVWDHKSHDCGASLISMCELAEELGYTLVGRPTNPHSPNLFFVRDDLVGALE